MKKTMILTGTLANAIALSGSAVAETAPNSKVVDPWRRFPPTMSSPATFYKACLRYDEKRKSVVGECNDSVGRYQLDKKGQQYGCPKGTVLVISSKPIRNCIQPMIL